MSVGNKIIYNFPRPAKELVEQFRGMPVANIDDNMGRIAAVDSAIVPINSSPLVGTAFTIRAPQGDNLMFHKAMDMAQPGDVIMIDAGGSVDRAIFGELMATYCRSRGIAGIVCDGAIRDCDGLSKMTDFAVYAKGVTPNGPYKNGPGEINTPVVIGGKLVLRGLLALPVSLPGFSMITGSGLLVIGLGILTTLLGILLTRQGCRFFAASVKWIANQRKKSKRGEAL